MERGAAIAKARRQGEVRRRVWRMEAYGFSHDHAVNLVAVEFGVKPNDHQWREDEVADLLFWRDSYLAGRLKG
jgi:hypothetical protein